MAALTQEALEAAAAAFVTDLLAEDETLAEIDYVVVRARSQETPPGDRSEVVVNCSELSNFREILKEGMIDCYVRSPADIEGVTLATHSAITAALEAAWASANYSAWATAVAAAATGWTGANFYREGWTTGSEGTDWLPALRIKVGARLA